MCDTVLGIIVVLLLRPDYEGMYVLAKRERCVGYTILEIELLVFYDYGATRC
jgi:hypothetical protein